MSETVFCAELECSLAGAFRAPIRKMADGEIMYGQFCKVHARERNVNWNYFSDMNDDEVEDFRHQSYSWHRRTSADGTAAAMYEALHKSDFMHDDILFSGLTEKNADKADESNVPKARRILPNAVYDALRVMHLDEMPDERVLKKQFRLMAKRYHPDLQQNNDLKDQLAEQLKVVNSAYKVLQEYLYSEEVL